MTDQTPEASTDNLLEGTPVRFWPGFRDGASKIGRIEYTGRSRIGGTGGYYVRGAGFISAGHIEPLPIENGTMSVANAAEAFQAADWEVPGVNDIHVTDRDEALKLARLARGMRGLL